MAKRGLITDADRRSFLEDKYAEMLESDYNKALNKELETEYYAGTCPYCGNANRLFENKGIVEQGKHKVVKAICSNIEDIGIKGCGHEVYIIVAVKAEGNMFQGFKYVPSIKIIKPEELKNAFTPPQLRKEDPHQNHRNHRNHRNSHQGLAVNLNRHPQGIITSIGVLKFILDGIK